MPIEDFVGKIIEGDCVEVIKQMPDESVDMIITSPPYFGLRNYQVEGQLGLEKTFAEYLDKMIEIMKEIKRVVKKEGQIWINFGDCYGGLPAGNKTISPANQGYDGVFVRKAKQGQGAKSFVYSTDNERMFSGKSNNSRLKQTAGEKCLLMMPERFTIRCIDELGLILRNKICWAKQVLIKKENRTMGSVMPTSVKDRFNESGEELYFFVKNKKYYSDLDAVRLKTENTFDYFNRRVRDAQKGIGPQFKASEKEIMDYGAKMSKIGGQTIQGIERKRLEDRMTDTKNKDQKSSRTYNIKKLLSEVRLGIKPNTGMERKRKSLEELKAMGVPATYIGATGEDHNLLNNPFGKNLPTIWQIGSEPHNFQKELGSDYDHFATFPQALLEIPIKFGSPKGGIILDPFMGAGTSAIVAKKLGRNFIGIELNPKYIELAEKRLKIECPPTLF